MSKVTKLNEVLSIEESMGMNLDNVRPIELGRNELDHGMELEVGLIGAAGKERLEVDLAEGSELIQIKGYMYASSDRLPSMKAVAKEMGKALDNIMKKYNK